MTRRRHVPEILLIGAIIAAISASSMATETVTYNYDAKGRLINVQRSGTVNNGVTANYAHDRANNRTNVTVTGSPNPPP
jgi:YD repeat-containing protein